MRHGPEAGVDGRPGRTPGYAAQRHRAVLGQLLTWMDLLAPAGGLFEDEYPHLAFERPDGLPIEVGIDDAAWCWNEDPDEAAKLDTDEAAANLLF